MKQTAWMFVLFLGLVGLAAPCSARVQASWTWQGVVDSVDPAQRIIVVDDRAFTLPTVLMINGRKNPEPLQSIHKGMSVRLTAAFPTGPADGAPALLSLQTQGKKR